MCQLQSINFLLPQFNSDPSLLLPCRPPEIEETNLILLYNDIIEILHDKVEDIDCISEAIKLFIFGDEPAIYNLTVPAHGKHVLHLYPERFSFDCEFQTYNQMPTVSLVS